MLGMEFLMEAKISRMLHLNGVMVNDETTPCFVRAASVDLGAVGLRFASIAPTKP